MCRWRYALCALTPYRNPGRVYSAERVQCVVDSRQLKRSHINARLFWVRWQANTLVQTANQLDDNNVVPCGVLAQEIAFINRRQSRCCITCLDHHPTAHIHQALKHIMTSLWPPTRNTVHVLLCWVLLAILLTTAVLVALLAHLIVK